MRNPRGKNPFGTATLPRCTYGGHDAHWRRPCGHLVIVSGRSFIPPELFPTEEEQEKERQRLHTLLAQLVKWENSNNEEILEAARAEIRKYMGDEPLTFLDPFAGEALSRWRRSVLVWRLTPTI